MPHQSCSKGTVLSSIRIRLPENVLTSRSGVRLFRTVKTKKAIISRLFGSASYTSHMTGAGIEVTVEGIGTLSFSDSDPLFIGYVSDGCSYDGSYDEAASDPESDRQVSWMRRKNLSNQLNQFLSGGEGSSLTSDEKRAETEVDLAIYDRSERRYIAHFRQKLDGCVIDGSGGYLSVKNDKIEYLKCSVVLLSRPVGYNADLLDEINVLFLERDAFADATVFSEDESLSSAPSPEETTRHVTGSSPLYCVIWNSDRSEFYLIPSWMIEYSDGSESKRNAVNGNVYSR